MAHTVTNVITGGDLIDAVCKAQGVDPTLVRRVVVDAPFDDIAIVYTEMAGSSRLLDVDWGADGVTIRLASADDYVCPECGKPGLPSALDSDCCTECANRKRGV